MDLNDFEGSVAFYAAGDNGLGNFKQSSFSGKALDKMNFQGVLFLKLKMKSQLTVGPAEEGNVKELLVRSCVMVIKRVHLFCVIQEVMDDVYEFGFFFRRAESCDFTF